MPWFLGNASMNVTARWLLSVRHKGTASLPDRSPLSIMITFATSWRQSPCNSVISLYVSRGWWKLEACTFSLPYACSCLISGHPLAAGDWLLFDYQKEASSLSAITRVRYCRHHIIASDVFSAWVAWLMGAMVSEEPWELRTFSVEWGMLIIYSLGVHKSQKMTSHGGSTAWNGGLSCWWLLISGRQFAASRNGISTAKAIHSFPLNISTRVPTKAKHSNSVWTKNYCKEMILRSYLKMVPPEDWITSGNTGNYP